MKTPSNTITINLRIPNRIKLGTTWVEGVQCVRITICVSTLIHSTIKSMSLQFSCFLPCKKKKAAWLGKTTLLVLSLSVQ